MPEFHQLFSLPGPGDNNMQNVFQRIRGCVTSSAGILQFTTNGTKSGGVNGVDPTTATFNEGRDYMTIEPVNEYPGGGKWQIQLIQNGPLSGTFYSSPNYHMHVSASFVGGFDIANVSVTNPSGFDETSNQFLASNTFLTTDSPNIAENVFYFSAGNLDTYSSSTGIQTYTYLRLLVNKANDNWKGFYIGGYIPTAPDLNTKPVVFLAGLAEDGTEQKWITNTTSDFASQPNRNNINRVPADNAHSALAGTSKATLSGLFGSTGGLSSDDARGPQGFDREGQWVNWPFFVNDISAGVTLGTFGKYTMLMAGADRTVLSADSNGEYLVTGGPTSGYIVNRWNP